MEEARRSPKAARASRVLVRVLPVAAVAALAAAAAVAALAAVRVDRELSVGTVRLSVEPGHRGALDLYVPLVDWGARFHAVRLPARLRVDVRSLDRDAVVRLARGGSPDTARVRAEGRDAIAAYLRLLVVGVALAALGVGVLAAFALRGVAGTRLRTLVVAAVATAAACGAAVALLLPPRGRLEDPVYYANAAGDVPRALRAIEDATTSARTLGDELESQLVGIARLVEAPAERGPASGLPRVALASDLHNNVLALPALSRAAEGLPLFFAGDLTDRGSPLETRLVRRIARIGTRAVFVTGNHDSDRLARALVRAGAVVLTERGRLRRDGTHGPVVVEVAGLRVAGYSDPFERRAADDFADRTEADPGEERRRAFAAWLRPLIGSVDAVMVHSPGLARLALDELQRRPPSRPLVFLVGHTHSAEIETGRNIAVVNGGTVGAGGTGNLDEGQPIGLAILTYEVEPRFQPVAADIVEIDPGDGSARAERVRLDVAPVSGERPR